MGLLTLDDEIRAQDTHSSNANTGLGGTVGGTEAGEDNSASATHGAEEGLEVRKLALKVTNRSNTLHSRSRCAASCRLARGGSSWVN